MEIKIELSKKENFIPLEKFILEYDKNSIVFKLVFIKDTKTASTKVFKDFIFKIFFSESNFLFTLIDMTIMKVYFKEMKLEEFSISLSNNFKKDPITWFKHMIMKENTGSIFLKFDANTSILIEEFDEVYKTVNSIQKIEFVETFDLLMISEKFKSSFAKLSSKEKILNDNENSRRNNEFGEGFDKGEDIGINLDDLNADTCIDTNEPIQKEFFNSNNKYINSYSQISKSINNFENSNDLNQSKSSCIDILTELNIDKIDEQIISQIINEKQSNKIIALENQINKIFKMFNSSEEVFKTLCKDILELEKSFKENIFYYMSMLEKKLYQSRDFYFINQIKNKESIDFFEKEDEYYHKHLYFLENSKIFDDFDLTLKLAKIYKDYDLELISSSALKPVENLLFISLTEKPEIKIVIFCSKYMYFPLFDIVCYSDEILFNINEKMINFKSFRMFIFSEFNDDLENFLHQIINKNNVIKLEEKTIINSNLLNKVNALSNKTFYINDLEVFKIKKSKVYFWFIIFNY